MDGSLEIRLLGTLRVSRDGEAVELPQSRKTRALLASLVLRDGAQRRDALCEQLWERSDDPRGSLRWSLSKLRPLLNTPERERLRADREQVRFERDGARIDIVEVEQACARGLAQLEAAELERLAGLFEGPLLSGLELPQQPEFETWRLGEQERARRLHVEILRALIARLGPDAQQTSDWLRQLIEVESHDVAAHVALIRHLLARGRKVEASRQLDASARLLAESGGPSRAELEAIAATSARQTPGNAQASTAPVASTSVATSAPVVRFCHTADRVRIAYALGGEGPPLLKTANWLNHLEFDWSSPFWRHLFGELSRWSTLVRYDERGNGLSDWDVEDLCFEAFVSDLEAVVEAAGLERFPIFAVSQGCPVAIEYAARHPGKVSALVLYGGFARGWRHASSPAIHERLEAMMTLARDGWGRDNAAFRQMFTSMYMPEATAEQCAWFNELQRNTTSPQNVVRLLSAFGEIDVRERLAAVRVPTLVAHCRGDVVIPYALGRELAMGIPGARLLSLEANNHLLLEGSPASRVLLDEMRAFLAL